MGAGGAGLEKFRVQGLGGCRVREASRVQEGAGFRVYGLGSQGLRLWHGDPMVLGLADCGWPKFMLRTAGMKLQP